MFATLVEFTAFLCVNGVYNISINMYDEVNVLYNLKDS